MSPDDPRHGTYAGAAVHWKAGERACPACARAALRRRKRNHCLALAGTPATVPAAGTVRRLQALQAVGWTITDVARESGLHEKTLRNPVYRGARVYRATADAVADAYERLSMTFPDGPYATRARRRAQRLGYPPPLAWDDDTIDDPDALPLQPGEHDDQPDPVVVERILAGDWRLAATQAERRLVVAAWLERGGSQNELERLTGWAKVYKLVREVAA